MKLSDQGSLFAPRAVAPERFEDLPAENRFLSHAHAGRNVFLTGMAGTGKSTLLRQFIGEATRKIDLCATTGIAAINLGGMTIHRFCGMGIGPAPGVSNEVFFGGLMDERRPSTLAGFNRVKAAQCVVIDEISMLPGRQFEFIEFLFRRLRGNEKPFGGVQIVATGDFLQLPPVRTNRESAYDWAFTSPAWEVAEFKVVILETVRRQDEPRFVELLGNFRRGRCVGADAATLQFRVQHFVPSNVPRLLTHNLQVDKWNNYQLGGLEGDAVALRAEEDGPDFQRVYLKKNLLTPDVLELKRGARVMFTVNKSVMGQREPLFVNGQTGCVAEFSGGQILVQRDGDGRCIWVEPFTWRYGKEPGSATFTQFPLRLAYAMTIHKSQGLTLKEAHIDICAALEPGQVYVAISRVRSLDGLSLRGWFKGVAFSPRAVEFYGGLGR